MREQLVNLILQRLNRDAEKIAADFAGEKGVATRYCAIDDLLPEDVARKIADSFPDGSEMRLMKSFREHKYTSKSLDNTFAFQDKSGFAKKDVYSGKST